MNKKSLIGNNQFFLGARELSSKILKTICFFFGFISIGYYYTISGLTLGLLQKNTGLPESILGLILSFRGAGLLCGVFFTGWVYGFFCIKEEKKNQDALSLEEEPKSKSILQLFIKFTKRIINLHSIINSASILISVCLFIVPFVTNIYILFVIHFLVGFGSSFIEIGCYIGITRIWKKKVDIVSQLMQAFFGIGNLVFPIIISQFFEFFDNWKTQLTISYFVCATMCYIPSVLFFIMTPPSKVEAKEEPKSKIDQTGNQDVCVKSKKSNNFKKLFNLKNLLMILTGLLKCCFLSVQVGFAGLLFSYCQRLKLDTDANLAILTSFFYISFTISRFFSGIITIFIRPIYILSICIVSSVVIFILFLFFGEIYVAVWILSILFAFFSGPGSAGTLVMLQSSFGIKLTASATSFLMFGQYIGEMGGVTLMTTLSDDALLGVNGIIIVSLILLAFSFFIFVGIIGIGFIYNKYDPERKEQINEEMKEKLQKLEEKRIKNERKESTSKIVLPQSLEVKTIKSSTATKEEEVFTYKNEIY